MKKIVLLFFMVLFVSCHGDFVELSDKYVYCEYTIAKSPSKSKWTSDGKYIPYTVVIDQKVTNFSHDDDYIIAHRIGYRNYEKLHDYWIIRLADDKIWGPLSKDSFDIMCKEQNVQISLDPKYDTDAE